MQFHLAPAAAAAVMLLLFVGASGFAADRVVQDDVCTGSKPFREVAQDETRTMAELCAIQEERLREERGWKAYRLDWLGWFYVKLLPLTNGLYGLVEAYFPNEVKYKVRAAITDDLGQRSLFLLLLTAAVELTLYSVFKFLKLIAFSRRLNRGSGA